MHAPLPSAAAAAAAAAAAVLPLAPPPPLYHPPAHPTTPTTNPPHPSSSIKAEKDEKSERLKVKKAIEKGNLDGAKIYAENSIRKKSEALNYLKLASRLDATVSRLDTQVGRGGAGGASRGPVKFDRPLTAHSTHSCCWMTVLRLPWVAGCMIRKRGQRLVGFDGAGCTIPCVHASTLRPPPPRAPDQSQAKMGQVTKSMAAITKNLEKALAGSNLEKVAETMQQFEKQFENLDLQTQVRALWGAVGVGAWGLVWGLVWAMGSVASTTDQPPHHSTTHHIQKTNRPTNHTTTPPHHNPTKRSSTASCPRPPPPARPRRRWRHSCSRWPTSTDWSCPSNCRGRGRGGLRRRRRWRASISGWRGWGRDFWCRALGASMGGVD